MERKYNIGEVSKLLEIPKSTLRYWEEENLIQMERNKTNDYRVYTLKELMNIWDVDLYRKLGIPVSKLKSMYEWDIGTWDDRLLEQIQVVEEKIQKLSHIREELRYRKDKVNQIADLKKHSFTIGEPDIEIAVSFDMEDKDMISNYLQDPYSCIIIIPPGVPKEEFNPIYGFAVDSKSISDEVIWERRQKPRKYIQCLLQVSREDPVISNYYEIIKDLQEIGVKTGVTVGRFLATAKDSICYDFYKIWIEIIS